MKVRLKSHFDGTEAGKGDIDIAAVFAEPVHFDVPSIDQDSSLSLWLRMRERIPLAPGEYSFILSARAANAAVTEVPIAVVVSGPRVITTKVDIAVENGIPLLIREALDFLLPRVSAVAQTGPSAMGSSSVSAQGRSFADASGQGSLVVYAYPSTDRASLAGLRSPVSGPAGTVGYLMTSPPESFETCHSKTGLPAGAECLIVPVGFFPVRNNVGKHAAELLVGPGGAESQRATITVSVRDSPIWALVAVALGVLTAAYFLVGRVERRSRQDIAQAVDGLLRKVRDDHVQYARAHEERPYTQFTMERLCRWQLERASSLVNGPEDVATRIGKVRDALAEIEVYFVEFRERRARLAEVFGKAEELDGRLTALDWFPSWRVQNYPLLLNRAFSNVEGSPIWDDDLRQRPALVELRERAHSTALSLDVFGDAYGMLLQAAVRLTALQRQAAGPDVAAHVAALTSARSRLWAAEALTAASEEPRAVKQVAADVDALFMQHASSIQPPTDAIERRLWDALAYERLDPYSQIPTLGAPLSTEQSPTRVEAGQVTAIQWEPTDVRVGQLVRLSADVEISSVSGGRRSPLYFVNWQIGDPGETIQQLVRGKTARAQILYRFSGGQSKRDKKQGTSGVPVTVSIEGLTGAMKNLTIPVGAAVDDDQRYRVTAAIREGLPALAIAVCTGWVAVYFKGTAEFGTPGDYLGAFLWGSVTQGVVDSVKAAMKGSILQQLLRSVP